MTDPRKTVEDVRSLLDEGERIKGLGDVIAKATKKLGVRECAPCAQRRKALNSLVPFGPRPRKK